MVELILQKRKKRNQKVLIVTVCTMICFTPIVHFINQLCRTIFGKGFELDTLFCYAALAAMLLASLKQLHFQIKIDALLIMVIFILAYVLAYSFGDGNADYMFTDWTDFASNPVYLLFVYSIPAYIFMRYITDFDLMFEICRHFSVISVFCGLGSFVLMNVRGVQPEYMSFSYSLLFSTIFSSVCFFEKKKIMSLIAGIIGIILIFFAGARGPLLCFVFGLAAYFLFSKASAAKKIFLIFFLLTAGLIIIVLWEQVLTALQAIADALGISSRTVDRLIEGNFGSDSGRGEIQQKIIESFSLFGRGLYGDRVVGEDHYSHNLFIELISQWGLLFGMLIIIFLGVLFFKGFRTKNTTLQMLILVLFSSSVVKLMLSESYLAHNAVFFVLIAACVNSFDAPAAMPIVEEPVSGKKKQSKYIKSRGFFKR